MAETEDKAEAEAREARAKADKEEEALAEWRGDLAKRQREAEARKATAVAEKEAAEARRAKLTGLIPDFSKVERGETTVTGDHPMFAAVLAAEAADRAAWSIKEQVKEALAKPGRILITTDADLATSDAAYGAVAGGVEALISAADKAAAAVVPESGPGDLRTTMLAPGPVIGAIASAVPAVISLLSAKRTVKSFAVTVDDVTAVAAVAGKLATIPDVEVQVDDLRTVPKGPLAARVETLQEKRDALFEQKVGSDFDRVQSGLRRTAHEERLKALHATADKARADGKEPTAETLSAIEAVVAERDNEARSEKTSATRLAVVDDVLTAIETFLTAISAVPEGGTRSALTTAALREQLRLTEGPCITEVLLINATAGSADQLLSDQPLWAEDKFAVLAGINIAHVLVDPRTNDVKRSGNATATAKITGVIGGEIRPIEAELSAAGSDRK